MDINPIHNDDDLRAALARVDALWGAPSNTPEGDELEMLAIRIEEYEAERYPLPASDSVIEPTPGA